MNPDLKFYLCKWFEYELVRNSINNSENITNEEKTELELDEIDDFSHLLEKLSKEDLDLLSDIVFWVKKSNYSEKYIKSLRNELFF